MDTIQALIFDFGRVLCEFDINRFLRRAIAYSPLPLTDLQALMGQSMDLARRYESGLMSSTDFYTEISSLASLQMPFDEFREAYSDIFTPIPSTFRLVRSLKGRYRLGLLSNTSEWHFQYGIRLVDVFPLFDTVTLSYVVHAMKPDPRIYQDALSKLRLPATACVYIDDIPEFVQAGRTLGLNAIHYTGYEPLAEELRRMGVRWEPPTPEEGEPRPAGAR